MTKFWNKVSGLLALVVLCMACAHSVPIENVDHSPIPTGNHALSNKQVGDIIAQAAIGRGWTVNETKPGFLSLKITRHETYVAQTEVRYNTKSYSIKLISSENLDQSDGLISSAYNRYIDYLKIDIDKGLNAAVFQ